ncbi:MAG: DUF1524 domain-containing protein [Pseudomonadota bacterium]|nr:DUF1524 domain-containing protein [Pseudomonadota bacterium]
MPATINAEEIPPFDPALYPIDTNINGTCRDLRNQALFVRSAGTAVLSEDGCTVISGVWEDRYGGYTLTGANVVDVEHLVPLEEAHYSGAYKWDDAKRRAFANDVVLFNALMTTLKDSNAGRGSKDPASWLPREEYTHCHYVKSWTEVKRRYGLEMDDAERAAIEKILGAPIETAARRESTGWEGIMREPSDAVFGLGMRVAGECPYVSQLSPNQYGEISISVLPDRRHVGQTFDIFLVAELPTGLYSIDINRNFTPFTGEISSLVPYYDDLLLHRSFEFSLSFAPLNQDLVTNLYIGYLTQRGNFIYSRSPLPINVTSNEVIVTGEFIRGSPP